MADAQASGACYGNIVWVQVPSPASLIIPEIICGSVGTGRRARLRILWWLHRVGSSPIFRIHLRRCCFTAPSFIFCLCLCSADRTKMPAAPCSRHFLMNASCCLTQLPSSSTCPDRGGSGRSARGSTVPAPWQSSSREGPCGARGPSPV